MITFLLSTFFVISSSFEASSFSQPLSGINQAAVLQTRSIKRKMANLEDSYVYVAPGPGLPDGYHFDPPVVDAPIYAGTLISLVPIIYATIVFSDRIRIQREVCLSAPMNNITRLLTTFVYKYSLSFLPANSASYVTDVVLFTKLHKALSYLDRESATHVVDFWYVACFSVVVVTRTQTACCFSCTTAVSIFQRFPLLN